VYQYIKYHEARKAVKGHPGAPDIEVGQKYISNSQAPSTAAIFSRSKADILSEMKRLQNELTEIGESQSSKH
jgi:signal transduction protein with GAF and PtsI domain